MVEIAYSMYHNVIRYTSFLAPLVESWKQRELIHAHTKTRLRPKTDESNLQMITEYNSTHESLVSPLWNETCGRLQYPRERNEGLVQGSHVNLKRGSRAIR